jgi:hypothetical protein
MEMTKQKLTQVKVKASADWQLESEGKGKGPSFKEGEILDVRSDFATKLIRRNVAAPFTGRKKGRRFPPDAPAAADPVAEENTTVVDFEDGVTDGGAGVITPAADGEVSTEDTDNADDSDGDNGGDGGGSETDDA